MDGTPMTTSTRKGWQSHGSHAHVQTAMLVIAVVDTATTLGETSRETPPHITGTEENG